MQKRKSPSRLKRHNQGQVGLGALAPVELRDTVNWYDETGRIHRSPPSRTLLDRDLHLSRRARTAPQHANQVNYPGLYWQSQLDSHIWYESLFEMTALMWLDYRHELRGLASQPMLLQFADGTKHFPDFFALHANGRQVLYDVKPADRISDRFRAQAQETRRICDEIGWGYEIFTGIDRVLNRNLTWLSAYRSPRYRPESTLKDAVLARFEEPMEFGAATQIRLFENKKQGISTISSLLWTRALTFDMSHPLCTQTNLKRES